MNAQSSSSRKLTSGTAYAWYVVLILMLCQALSQIDAKLPFILVEALKEDLDLSDTQIGIITGPAFSLTYAIFGLPIAKLSDRYVRKYVIASAIVIWSACTAGGGVAMGFAAFAFSRMGVAVAEAALMPAAHSIIAGYMPSAARPKAIAVYSLGIPLGAFLALWLGGIIADMHGWRWALMLVGGSGLVLAMIVLSTLKEPVRQAEAVSRRTLPKGDLRSLLRDPVVRNIVLGGGLMGLSAGAFTGWGPAYIMRSFGLSATETGQTFGTVIGLLGVTGTLAGGFIASWLSAKHPSRAILTLSIALIFAGITQFFSLISNEYYVFLALTAASVLLTSFYFAPTYATIQSQVDPSARAFAAAVTLFFINGVGLALGAFLTGVFSDLLAPTFGEESLRWSLLVLTSVKAWSVLHYFLAARALRRVEDEEAAN